MLWILLILSAVGAFGQFTTTARHIGPYASAPANCSTASGDIYYNTTSKTPFYCSATNTWTAMGGGSGAPPAGSAVTDAQCWASASTFGVCLSPAFASPTVTTQSAKDNSTKTASTAYVDRNICTTTITTFISGSVSTCFTVNQEATAGQGVTYTLPTAASGSQYCIDNGWNGSAANTGVLTLSTSASGQFIVFTDGTLSASGGNVNSGGAARDGACVYGIDSTHWMFLPHSGTWTKN